MAYEIHWLRRASEELEAIFRFYNHFASDKVAKFRVETIINSVDNLEFMPFLGQKDEDFTYIREYRYLVVLTYKVYYFVEGHDVFVASVWDCRQGSEAF